MDIEFPQFAVLPLELRRLIWRFAVLSDTQDIHFQISKPKEAWEALDPPYNNRKHLFTSDLFFPPYLYTCHESRAAALQHYILGINLEAKNAWSWRANQDNDIYSPCLYDGQAAAVAKKTYWAPESDVIVLEHGAEPHTCENNTICNFMRNRRDEYKFDERIKYMAVTMDIWNTGTEGMMLHVPGLEVLFVLVDRKPCFAFLGQAVRILGTGEGKERDAKAKERLRESCRLIEGQMTDALKTNTSIFQLKRVGTAILRVEVVLVESIKEMKDEVARRRDAHKRAAIAAATANVAVAAVT